MMQSENINELAAALAKAQGAIQAAVKGKVNPAFKSKYADLAAVWDACREQLSANGLAIVQTFDTTADGVFLTTTLAHSSGQWMRSVFPVRPVKNDPQGLGSATTYARRYSLAAMVGVAPDDDDDGNAASHAGNGNGHAPAPRPSGERITENQARDLEALADEVGANKPALLKYFNVPTFADISASMYQAVLAALEKKRKAAA